MGCSPPPIEGALWRIESLVGCVNHVAGMKVCRAAALRDAGEAHRRHQLADTPGRDAPIQASWITVTSAFSAVLRGSRNGGKYDPKRSSGMLSWSEPSG